MRDLPLSDNPPLVPPALLDPVIAYFNPRRVIVFGSVARGEAGPDSDIDLLVIVDDDTPAEKVTLKAGYEFPKIISRSGGRDPGERKDLSAERADRWNVVAGRGPGWGRGI